MLLIDLYFTSYTSLRPMHTSFKRSATQFLTLALFALSMAGCSSSKLSATSLTTPVNNEVVKTDARAAAGPVTAKVIGVHPLDDAQSALGRRTIYFDYDSARVASSSTPLLEAHSRYLCSQTRAKIRLEGHADERGGREYNLALGQKRADAVR